MNNERQERDDLEALEKIFAGDDDLDDLFDEDGEDEQAKTARAKRTATERQKLLEVVVDCIPSDFCTETTQEQQEAEGRENGEEAQEHRWPFSCRG